MPLREVTASPALPRYWMDRLYCACAILATLLITWAEPASLLHRAIARSGPEGWWCVGALCVLAALAGLDVVVNDMLPPRFSLPGTERFRHVLFLALGMGLLSVTYVLAEAVGFSPVLLLLPVHAAFTVAIAFFDLFHRHRHNHDKGSTP